MKTCSKCNSVKEYSDFCKSKNHSGGYYPLCKSCLLNYRKENKDKIKDYGIQYRKQNKDIIKEKNKLYLANLNEDKKERIKINKRKNRKGYGAFSEEEKYKVLERRRELYQKQKEDPLFNLKKRIRNAMRRAHLLNGFKKNNLTNNLLGCDYEFFKSYIEAQFTKDMNWDNIHLDHIKPLSSANTIEKVYQVSHYTNFQPLLAKDNIIKSDKIIEKQLRLL